MEPELQLSDEQKKLLAWLDRNGAVSPSQVLAQTDFAPREAWQMLQQLAEMGLVVIREDPNSPDGTLVLPTSMSLIKQQARPADKR